MEDNVFSYSTVQVCQILNIKRYQFYQLARAGRLKAFNIGMGTKRKRWRVKKENLDDFIKKGGN